MGKNYVIFGFLCLVIGAAGFFFSSPFTDTAGGSVFASISESEDAPDLNSFHDTWVPHINTVGAEVAYADFLKTYQDETPNQQHVYAHAFGNALYTATQLEGVSVCDQSFSFGCFHEFLGHAIHDEGLSVVSYLNEQCIEALKDQALGCQHGIGHGVTAYLGYAFDALQEALAICRELPVSDPIGGCYGGVFMEYNLQTVLGNEAEVREFSQEKGAHYPCTSLDAAYREACYFWQPQWWQSAIGGEVTQEKMFTEMGGWCEEATNDSYADQCYRGIGNNAPGGIGWDVSNMVSVCESMPTERGNMLCRSGAVGAFHAVPSLRSVAQDICSESLTKKQANQCRELMNIPG